MALHHLTALRTALVAGTFVIGEHEAALNQLRGIRARLLDPARENKWGRQAADYLAHADTLAALTEQMRELHAAHAGWVGRNVGTWKAAGGQPEPLQAISRLILATCCSVAQSRNDARGVYRGPLTDAALAALLDETPAAAVVPLRRRA